MSEIIKNPILPVKLAMTRVFHIAGTRGYMNNFIAPVKKSGPIGEDEITY